MKRFIKVQINIRTLSIAMLCVAFFLLFISGCATTAKTKPADFMASNFNYKTQQVISVLPVLDHRIDQSKQLSLDDWILPMAEDFLKKRGYYYSIHRERSLVLNISSDALESPTKEFITSLKPASSNLVLIFVLEDSTSKMTFGSSGNAEMSGYLFDKVDANLIWRDKEVAQVGQGGLAGMLIKKWMEEGAVQQAAMKVLQTLPPLDRTSLATAPQLQDQTGSKGDPDLITINLLEQPYHIGDNNVSRFENIDPQGLKFESGFDIAHTNLSDIFISIWVSDMVPRYHKQFLNGYYKNKLVVNGSKIAILNRQIPGREDKPDVEQITIKLDKHVLKKGYNEIKIIAGNRKQNHDDFQLHKIIVGYKLN